MYGNFNDNLVKSKFRKRKLNFDLIIMFNWEKDKKKKNNIKKVVLI